MGDWVFSAFSPVSAFGLLRASPGSLVSRGLRSIRPVRLPLRQLTQFLPEWPFICSYLVIFSRLRGAHLRFLTGSLSLRSPARDIRPWHSGGKSLPETVAFSARYLAYGWPGGLGRHLSPSCPAKSGRLGEFWQWSPVASSGIFGFIGRSASKSSSAPNESGGSFISRCLQVSASLRSDFGDNFFGANSGNLPPVLAFPRPLTCRPAFSSLSPFRPAKRR